jgi:hypothetical protein
MASMMDHSSTPPPHFRPLRRTPRTPQPAGRAYVLVGVTVTRGIPSTRTILLDTQFRFTALRSMLAGGVQRIAIASADRPTRELIERGKQLAFTEIARAVRSGGRTKGTAEQIGLVASYEPRAVSEDTPLIAVTASYDEATSAALEFIENGAVAIDVVHFDGAGVGGLVQTMLDLVDDLAKENPVVPDGE